MTSIPLDTLLTAVTCILTQCNPEYSSTGPFATLNTCSISKSCELKAETATNTMKEDLKTFETNINRIAKITTDIKNLRSNASLNILKRSISNSQLTKYVDDFTLPKDCTGQNNGTAEINVNDQMKPFKVMCDNNEKHGANWMIIANYLKGSMEFDYNASEYRTGYKNGMGDYFIGVEKLYAITNSKLQELLILLIDGKGIERHYAHYTAFAIADADKRYALNMLGEHSGDAADKLSSFIGRPINFVHGAYTGQLKVLIRPRRIKIE